jgi:L-methionine (R)-S-oxide reductase
LEPNPFDLAKEVFAIDSNSPSFKEQVLRLQKLNQIVERIHELVPVDWFGIYRRVEYQGYYSDFIFLTFRSTDSLIKEAYLGEPSRAVFPLTKEFAEISNNSWVGISGKSRVIQVTNLLTLKLTKQDVNAYDGPYYGK